MKFFDVQHPFFIPLWRRVALVVFCLGWAGIELWNGSPFWAILFGAIGMFCAHQFFIAFNPVMPEAEKQPEDQGGDAD